MRYFLSILKQSILKKILFNLSYTATELFWVSAGRFSEDTLRLLQHSSFNFSSVSRFLLSLVGYRFTWMTSRYVATQLLRTAENFGAILAFEIVVTCFVIHHSFAQVATVSSRLAFFASFSLNGLIWLFAFNFLNFESVFNFESIEPDIFNHFTQLFSADITLNNVCCFVGSK